ncbi:Nucleolar protein 14 [Halotydeus destructor]|nr:Nucleolar protein 14 [Halotydeus destructor]
MAKKKNKLKSLTVNRVKKASTEDKLNAFELRVNRVKHDVVGRKVTRSEIGKPNKSRHDAFKKRKESLLQEYKHKDKKTVFVDSRIKDDQGGVAARKAKVWKMTGANATQLGVDKDEILLTHRGRDLTKNMLNESVMSDDDEFDLLNKPGYVEKVHFGGGEDGKARAQAEFMSEMLEEKRRRQVEKEADIDLTEQLDQSWQTVRNLIRHKGGHQGEEKKVPAAYDMLVKELMFVSADKPKLELPTAVIRKEPPAPKGSEFNKKLDVIIEAEDISSVTKQLCKILSEEDKLTYENVHRLEETLSAIEVDDFDVQGFSFLMMASAIKYLRQKVQFKLIYLLRKTGLESLAAVWRSLFICETLLTLSSPQFLPEVVHLIQNILVLCLDDSEKTVAKIFSPYSKLVNGSQFRLNLSDIDSSNNQIKFTAYFDEEHPLAESLLSQKLADLILYMSEEFKPHPSYSEMFLNVKMILEHMVEHSKNCKSMAQHVLNGLKTEKITKTSIARKVGPVMLQMIEPKIESIHAKHKDEGKKLLKKYQREFKGAQREIRKDSAFIKKTWLDEVIQKDKTRKKKVNQLMSDLASQQTLFKKSKR